MSCNQFKYLEKGLIFGLILAQLSGALLVGFTSVAHAQRHGGDVRVERHESPRGNVRVDRHEGPPPADVRVERRDDRRGAVRVESRREVRDMRYQHDRSYPPRGQYVRVVPRESRVVVHGGVRYHFHGGVWYRPYGARFAIVAPPIGLFVPFLPPFFTTIWIGGIPYYYANEVYYAHRGDGYVVVEPPKGDVSQAPPPADKMFIYPREGQSEQQQADDRYQCHRWAVDQTGFDPTQPPPGIAESQRVQKYADYQRAMSACLDGRGYTVK